MYITKGLSNLSIWNYIFHGVPMVTFISFQAGQERRSRKSDDSSVHLLNMKCIIGKNEHEKEAADASDLHS